jgi:hypothetical protein
MLIRCNTGFRPCETYSKLMFGCIPAQRYTNHALGSIMSVASCLEAVEQKTHGKRTNWADK